MFGDFNRSEKLSENKPPLGTFLKCEWVVLQSKSILILIQIHGCGVSTYNLDFCYHIKFLRYRIFSSCVMHKKNYVHLILQIRSKANDVIKIAWTLSGFNFSAIGSLWRPLEAVLQPRHSDSVASPAKPRPLEAFKGQRWLKNWNHLKFRLFWSQY